jgi:hypothetical protein
MECREPGLVRDEDLLAYLAGERVRPRVEQHVANCAHCTQRLADLRRLDFLLLSKLYRWDCPPNQILGEYQLGMLDRETTLAVSLHLRACVACTAELHALGAFLADDPMLVAQASPAQATATPTAQTNNHHAHPRQAGGTLKRLLDYAGNDARRIIATLLPPAPRLASVRGATSNDLWPRRYSAHDFSLSLQVERATNRSDLLQLIGFVTRQNSPLDALQGTPVQLSSQADAPLTQLVDDLGNFLFSSLTPGVYALELQTSEGTIVIEQIPIEVQEK